MALQVNLINEQTLAGFFDFRGVGQVGNLDELASLGGFTAGSNVIGSRLIQTDQQVDFRFQFSVEGMFAHAFNPNFRWRIELYLERYGPLEYNFPAGLGFVELTYGSGDYVGANEVHFPGAGAPNSTTISIPGGNIPEGVYDVVAVIRLLHEAGNNTPCFLAAFAEFNKINFYQEH